MSVEKDNLIYDEMSEHIISAAERLVTSEGANGLTVRKILKELSITNRVFYNRFHNIGEVLEIVYKNTIMKIRECLPESMDEQKDFFEYVMDLLTNTLVMSYDTKMQFNHYVFQNDSVSKANHLWWTSQIKKLIIYAKEKDYIKEEVDPDKLSYAIWCFCRGYNADAVGRGIPREEAVNNFRYSFGFLLDGLKKQ